MKHIWLDLSEARAAIPAAKSSAELTASSKNALFAPTLFSNLAADDEDIGFRRITSPYSTRDLNPVMHERMQQVCFYLKATTPFGKRIVEIITSYVVGEAFKAKAEDEAAQQVVDRFWSDFINRIDQNLRDWCDELTTVGELCLPVVVNPVDGFVRVGYVDPQDIESVIYGEMTTEDGSLQSISVPVAVKLKQRMGDAVERRLEIIHRDEDPNSPTFGLLIGQCFYFAINKSKGASRGLSELFSLADWIDVFDQMVFDFADKVRFLNAFVWHYTVTGADEPSLEKFKKKVTQSPPKQGGVQVTNEAVAIDAVTPDFKGADMHESARMIKLYGLGGAGLPAWFFADPVDANRSTASEMEGPTGKKLTDRQNGMRDLVAQLLAFVLDKAIEKGVLPETVNRAVSIQVPDLSPRDTQKTSSTLQTTGNALALGEDRGWIRSETAAAAFHVVLTQIGVQIKPTEFADAQREKEQRQANEINNADPQANLDRALQLIQGGTAS